MSPPDTMIGGAQQGSGATGQIRHAQVGYYLFGRPVVRRHSRYGQLRQQFRRCGQGIVRRRFLPVVQQQREKFAGEVNPVA